MNLLAEISMHPLRGDCMPPIGGSLVALGAQRRVNGCE